MSLSSPEVLQEEAIIALNEGAWSQEDFSNHVHALKQVADKFPKPSLMEHEIYPKGNNGRANIEVNLPEAKNLFSVITLATDATVTGDSEVVGFVSKIQLLMDHKALQDLGVFLLKVAAKMEDLPEDKTV